MMNFSILIVHEDSQTKFLNMCMRVFENRMQRKTLGHKQSKVTSRWRKLHNEVIHNIAPCEI